MTTLVPTDRPVASKTRRRAAGAEQGAALADKRRRDIFETAAKLICKNGYDGTSVQDIAAACGLTKAGLYHHIGSKEGLLAAIMKYGMDLFEEEVLAHVAHLTNPLERLIGTMQRNLELVIRGSSKEITIILHEHATLHGKAGQQINARKKKYVHFLERAFAEAQAQHLIRPVNPTIAAYGFLGMVLWTYKWFRPGGALSEQALAAGMVDLLFTGLKQEGGA
jgi:AcrR family transcriptional regulator